jgi:hypothetical protein
MPSYSGRIAQEDKEEMKGRVLKNPPYLDPHMEALTAAHRHVADRIANPSASLSLTRSPSPANVTFGGDGVNADRGELHMANMRTLIPISNE